MMDELIGKIEQWAESNGINRSNGVTAIHQYAKIKEEFNELGDALNNMLNNSPNAETAEANANHVDLEIADLVIATIVLAKIHGTDIRTCLSKGYEKIEHRTGEIINGMFIRERD